MNIEKINKYLPMLKKFIDLNKSLSHKIEKKLPQYQYRIFGGFNDSVITTIEGLNKGDVILDIGGGRRSPFAKHIKKDVEVIGIDISDEELKLNPHLSRFVVCDVTVNLPFEDNSVDLIMSRSVVEHLNGVPDFVKEAHRVLKPNGKFIHLFPSKFAPFAIANRMLPNAIAKKILYKIHPHQVGLGGFKAYYEHCYYPAFPNLLEKENFNIHLAKAGFYQSNYFTFFLPFYLISALYEMILYYLDLKILGANLLVVASKK